MNGVQAAIFSGSAMILLVLALRLLLKKHLPRGIFPVLWCAQPLCGCCFRSRYQHI